MHFLQETLIHVVDLKQRWYHYDIIICDYIMTILAHINVTHLCNLYE